MVVLFQSGWRPGAISRRLLHKLNKAKRQVSKVEERTESKKLKQKAEKRPLLVVSKKNGEYRVEMQASHGKGEGNVNCSPVVYTIANEDNEERVERHRKRRQRIVQKAIDDIWEDPFHPEVCEGACVPAYKHAIGLSPQGPGNPECPAEGRAQCCSTEEDLSSDNSSMNLEWEFYFTPPVKRKDNNEMRKLK